MPPGQKAMVRELVGGLECVIARRRPCLCVLLPRFLSSRVIVYVEEKQALSGDVEIACLTPCQRTQHAHKTGQLGREVVEARIRGSPARVCCAVCTSPPLTRLSRVVSPPLAYFLPSPARSRRRTAALVKNDSSSSGSSSGSTSSSSSSSGGGGNGGS